MWLHLKSVGLKFKSVGELSQTKCIYFNRNSSMQLWILHQGKDFPLQISQSVQVIGLWICPLPNRKPLSLKVTSFWAVLYIAILDNKGHFLHEIPLMWPQLKTTCTPPAHYNWNYNFMNEPFLQLKGIVHPKLKWSFTHPQVVLKMYEFLLLNTKKIYLEYFLYYESQCYRQLFGNQHCSKYNFTFNRRKTHMFVTTWGWVNDVWTIPFKDILMFCRL